MRLKTPFLCFLVLLILGCGTHSAPRVGLFSVLANRDLWVFEDPTSLVTFSPSAVVRDLLPFDERGSAVTSSKHGLGSFVVVGSQTVAVQSQAHHPFKVAFNFHPNTTLYAATYVPTTSALVAVGVNRLRRGRFRLQEEIMFYRSEDGGFTWTSSSSWPSNDPQSQSYYSTGRATISFSPSGDFGLCHGGRSWTTTAWQPHWALSVAVLDPSLAVTTSQAWGVGAVYTSTDAGTTWLHNYLEYGTGIVLLDHQTWVVATLFGQIWRTTDGGKTCLLAWDRMAYNADWGALLAVGSISNGTGRASAMALSWDMGGQWLLSGPLGKAHLFDRVHVAPGTPSL